MKCSSLYQKSKSGSGVPNRPCPPIPPINQAFKRNAAILQLGRYTKRRILQMGHPWGRYTKQSNFYQILQIWHPWSRYTNCRISIEFYKFGTPGAVTQTVEFLSNFTNWAPLRPLHKLPNFYRIFKRGTTGAVPQTVKFLSRFKMGYPCGRHTNCPIFTTGPVTLTVLIHSWVCCTNRCSSRLAPF